MHSLLPFLILISVLIFVHELGHFMWAKILGVKVLTFSLGFPPKLFSRKIGETEYVISAIPLGGYVRMLGEEVGDEATPEDMKRAFHLQPVWKRFVIVVAGPIMNLLFPLLIYFVVLASIGHLRPATVGTVVPGDPADLTGIESGDRIVEIDGKAIHGFEDLRDVIGGFPGKRVEIAWLRDGKRMEGEIVPASAVDNVVPVLGLTKEVGRIGVYPVFPRPVVALTDPDGPAARAGLESRDLLTSVDGVPVAKWLDVKRKLSDGGSGPVSVSFLRPTAVPGAAGSVYVFEPGKATVDIPAGAGSRLDRLGADLSETFVSSVRQGTPAWAAGMREGDRILSINGREVEVWDQIGNTLRSYPDDVHTFTYRRPGGEIVVASLRQARTVVGDEIGGEQTRYTFGASGYGLYVEDDWVKNPNRITRALAGAFEGTWYYIRITGILFGRLVQGKVSLRTLGGPMMIFDIAGKSAKEGTETFLDTMALISINLGLINLFPIPIMDGGAVLLMLIESVRRQRLSDRFRAIYQYVGFGIIGLLVVLVFYNDISRYWERIIAPFSGN